MRLFIAIPLPREQRQAVLEVQQALIEHGAHGRFVPCENFHITLHFIGESRRLADLTWAMREACRDIRPFSLRFSSCGSFSGGKTVFLSVVCDNTEIHCLYESLDFALGERGFTRNRDHLIPHITLGRNMCGFDGFEWRSPERAFSVNEIVLYESERTDCVRYHALHRVPLT